MTADPLVHVLERARDEGAGFKRNWSDTAAVDSANANAGGRRGQDVLPAAWGWGHGGAIAPPFGTGGKKSTCSEPGIG